MGYTDAELAALSQTERDALAAIDEDGELELGLDDDDNDDDSDNDSDADSDDYSDDDAEINDKPAGDDKPADEIVAPAANLEVTIDDFDLDSVPAVNFVPKFSGELSAAHEAEIAALDAKLDEGELTSTEYRRAVQRVQAASQNEEVAAQLWVAEKAAFAKSLGYKTIEEFQEKAPAEFDVLNKEVIRVANNPETKGLTGIQTLYLAKHNLSEAAEIAEARAYLKAQKAGKAPDAKKTVPAKPAAQRPTIQTLRDVPAAEEQSVGQDKFASLDKLSGMALEKAVAKLSPTEYEAYTRGA